MRGLLSVQPPSAGLLNLGIAPRGQPLPAPQSLLNLPPQAPAPAPAPAQPRQRGKASGWRVLDRFLFSDDSIGEALDNERARQQRIADEPETRARAERLAAMAQNLGPMAELAFATNRDEFGKAMASNLEGYTLSAGGVRGGAMGPIAAAPTTSVVNDQIFVNNPMMGTSQAIARADPSFADVTARFNAENPVLPANSTWVGPAGTRHAQGYIAPQVTNTPAGGTTNVFDANGHVINAVQGNPDPSTQRAVQLTPQDRGAIQTARSVAQVASSRLRDVNRFIQLNQQRPTGLGAALLGPAAGLDPTYAEMRAISARLIPAEREPGSGPMSDKDIDLYARGVVDIDKPGPANQALAAVVTAAAQRDIAYAEFLEEYAQRNGNLLGATEDWQAFVNANPLFEESNGNTRVRRGTHNNWRQFMGWGERQRGQSGSAGGNNSQPVRVNSPAEARALPSGTIFIGPDGQRRRVP